MSDLMVEVGEKIPSVTLNDTEMKSVSLPADIKGKTVLAFFPGAFTGVCTKEMCTFRDDMSKLSAIKANVMAISVDSPFANKGFKEHNKLTFTVLSDYNRVAVTAFKIELNDFAGLKGYVAAKRSVFIVDVSGVVKYKWVSDDPRVEPNYNEVEAALA
jgi:peroxiredoxin